MTDRRLDKGQLSRVRKTPQGGIRVDAALTRVGIFNYRNADGSIRREFRSAEEVFRADSLASLAGAPVLDGHSTWVTPETWQQHARGHVVEGTPRQDGDLVAAELVVQHADTLDRVERRDLAEISCGYDCTYVPQPGVWKGQHYDGLQKNVAYNHIALLPAGAGRAGRECSIRLDAAESEIASTEPARESLVASIKLLDPGFREDGLSTEYLAGRLDALNGDRSGVFSDGHLAQLDHVRDVRAVSGLRREAPGIREDGSFSYEEVQGAAALQVREAWRQPSPFATTPSRAVSTREDGDQSFTSDEIRQRAEAQTRNAWQQSR